MTLRTCQNCTEPFDRHDLIPFLFMRAGNTVNCIHCLDRNYLIPKKTAGYWGMFCVATAFGLFIFSLVFDLMRFMGLRPGIMGAIFATIFIGVGIIVSVALARFVLKLWNWRNGELTLDDHKQSILDFG